MVGTSLSAPRHAPFRRLRVPVRLRGAVFEDSPLVKRSSALTLGFGVAWVMATSSELVASSD